MSNQNPGCSIWMMAKRVERTSLGRLRDCTRQGNFLYLESLRRGYIAEYPVVLEVYGVPLVGKSWDDKIAYVLANPTCDQLRFNCLDGANRVHFFAARDEQIYASLVFRDEENPLTQEQKDQLTMDLNAGDKNIHYAGNHKR
jgi:hypothetical protein